MVHRHGAVASMELSFSGSGPHPISRAMAMASGTPLEGPSETTLPDGLKVVEMTEERIFEIIEGYGRAALAAKNAGFGMVALHAAHGRALQHWFSPTMNRRTDRWGGSVENRCRFAVMAIDEIHRVCGRNFPVEIRISGSEIVKDGYGIDEDAALPSSWTGTRTSSMFPWEVSTATYRIPCPYAPELVLSPGRNAEYAAEIKARQKSYVGIAGGFSDPYFAEEVLASGQADIIYMARQLVCDPDMPNKVRTGKPRRSENACGACSKPRNGGPREYGLRHQPGVEQGQGKLLLAPAPVKQRVLVIGGGLQGCRRRLRPAGTVTTSYCVKSGELGGNILCESKVPFKDRLHDYRAAETAYRKSNIDLRLNTEVTPELAKNLRPDVIMAAVGSEPVIPDIPGVDGKNVYQAMEVFRNPSLAKGKVLILGAGLVGTELAIYLAAAAGSVEIVEMQGGISAGTTMCM